MAALARASVSGDEDRNKRLLLEAGEELLQQPPSSKEELLEKLDNLEHLLSRMKQVPLASARDAIRPAIKALVADGLLRYPDIDVKVSVASCISQIIRITAPDEPCCDRRLKEFFELAVLAFGKLSCLHGRCYSKAVSIIAVLAKYRMCVLMWDLKLDALIFQMFQHFLHSIRPDHPDQVFTDMKEIMSRIIKEGDEIPMQLLNILLSSVKKENQNVSPRSYVLGEKVLEENAGKLGTYLPKAVRCLGISTNNYAEAVERIWREAIKSKATDSADKVVREHGEELVGCRIRVWWPLDQVFYEGRITSFGHSEKRHTVLYEDGDEEILNLTKERWELVKDENTSDPACSCQIQEVVPGPSDLSDMRLSCNIDPSRHTRKKKKGNAADRVDVHGYKVLAFNAPILAPIFAKYGDIAVNCHNKSPASRAFFLDVLSDAVRALKTRDVKFSSIKAVKSFISDAMYVNLDVTWLPQYLYEISEEEDMEKRYSNLMALSETTMPVSEADKDL